MKIGDYLYQSYAILTKCGWVDNVNSGSSIVIAIDELTEDYIKLSKIYIELLSKTVYNIYNFNRKLCE